MSQRLSAQGPSHAARPDAGYRLVMCSWASRGRDGVLVLTLHVVPGAKTTEVAGTHGDRLKVRVAAPATDGRANTALVRFVAQRLGVAARQVRISAGAGSRAKTLRVEGGGVDPHALMP